MSDSVVSCASADIASVVGVCCRMDVLALKPGNVSVHSSGHGMTAEDFLDSAEAIAPILAEPGLGIGRRILLCVEATVDRVGCNTNLGIILLAAPLVSAALRPDRVRDLAYRLAAELKRLDCQDTAHVFEAIRLANPGGLGRSDRYDVSLAPPPVGLVEAMAAAAERDRIAYQYVHDFSDIFGIGLPCLRRFQRRWENAHDTMRWSTVACFLGFLSSFPDTHICRKFGMATARRVQRLGRGVETKFKACENPVAAVQSLLDFDKELKREGLNPGTSADLTLASLMAMQLEDLLIGARCGRSAATTSAETR